MQPIITICARKGSKGLPGKSTRLFNGKPLIAWTIETALDWGVGPVVISSDDKRVEEIFGEYMHHDNIYFDERPESLSNDDTPKLEVLRYLSRNLLYLSRKMQITTNKIDYVVDLDPTNPCRRFIDLKTCMDIYQKSDIKTLCSATDAKKSPFMNQFIRKNGEWQTPCKSAKEITCRQDTLPVLDVNSCIYFYNTEWLLDEKNIVPVSDNHQFYIMPDYARCDIDNEVDFKVAEFLHREYYLNGRSEK